MKKLTLLAILLIIFLGSSFVYAGTYSGGNGTVGDPYKIATLDDLIELSITTDDWWTKSFIQIAHIDATYTSTMNGGLGFSPIGNNTISFRGKYNGQNHTITNLYINRTTDHIGLFGYTNGATISNIGVVSCNITGQTYVGGLVGYKDNGSISNSYSTGNVTGSGNSVGGLVGYKNHGSISNSYSTGNVTGSGNSVGGLVGYNDFSGSISNSYSTGSVIGGSYVGGLVGHNYFYSSISNSYSTGSVIGGNSVGGLVGYNDFSGSISNSYSTGNVTGSSDVGGLAGPNSNSSTISNSYSTGNVTRSSGSSTRFGGFCGFNGATIKNCYSTGKVYSSAGTIWNEGSNKDKGFVGLNNAGTYTNNFFDSEASEQTDDCVNGTTATATTTANMKIQGTFTGWDFSGDAETDWVMSSPISFAGYPTFRWTGGYSVAPTSNQIATLPNLVWVAENSTRWATSYTQTANIVTWTTPSWDGNKGWTPIGNSALTFTGSYNGGGYKISNLYINRSTTDYIGLFGFTNGATISNVGVVSCNITGRFWVGGLVGVNDNGSSISNSYSTGSVSGTVTVGGLVGWNNSSSISYSYSTGSVTGSGNSVGGLVGYNDFSGSISNSYSTGSVSGADAVGGLAGTNVGGSISSGISNSYSTGSVSGANYVGGLAGVNENSSSISNSYSTGSVSGSGNVGGLVGANDNNGSIINSYSTGSVTGSNDFVGGLAGANVGGSIINSYSTGSVSGADYVGGFIGYFDGGTLIANYWKTDGVGGLNDIGSSGDHSNISETSDADMKKQATFIGWDFETTPIWNIESGAYISYPYLEAITYDAPGESTLGNPIPGLEGSPCQSTVNVDASFSASTNGWGVTHFADLSLALAGVCPGGTVNIATFSNTSYSGDNVSFDGLTVILGDKDFELTGNISAGLIKTTNLGKLIINDLSQSVPKTFPITDGTYNYTMTVNTANGSGPDISVRIKNNTPTGSMNSDFWDIEGPINLNATLTLRVDKAAIAPKTINNNTQLRYYDSSTEKYVPVNGNNFSVEEFDTYYIITITGVNKF